MLRPRISDIITIACRLSGAGMEEVISPARPLHLCAVRYAVYMTAREWGYSYPDIGNVVGRDHSTVMHALQTRRRLDSYIEDFDGFCAEVSRWADELPPFVAETNWHPPKVFTVHMSENLRQKREKLDRAVDGASGKPKGPGAGVYDHDMAYKRARESRIRNGSDMLLAALRAAA